VFLANADCVVAGLDVAFEAFRQVAQRIDGGVTPSFVVRRHDGEWCRGGGELGRVEASARTLLMGERTALNFLQRLSGIATRARQFVEAARGRVIVLDTRKTTPTLRVLEKYAVRAGGASNHRFGLFDAILIKDNHIRLGGGVRAAVDRVRASHPALPVEVEVQSLAELDEALAARSDMILVDNMTTSDIRKAVERVRGLAKIEVSGGVTLERLPELAMTGADYVSVGALTHSAPAVDISFDIEPLG
jgi:nicotinate-nucleotide pyrophosphorylase (carboxylating)